MNSICIITFYKFLTLTPEQVQEGAVWLTQEAEARGIHGLLILGVEGCNTTLSGSEDALKAYIAVIRERFAIDTLDIKMSRSDRHPFRRFQVKVRDEIVTLGKPEVLPLIEKTRHLSPEEWHRVMLEEDVVVLDTRNWYETQIGKFKNALDPNIDEFQEFPDYLRKAEIPKDKKVLIYCTGGIRCEKAIVEMHNQGFDNVYQLDGGILNYLEKFPNQQFDGECFVFDFRIAVDQNLQPTTQYKMCPHCGQPSNNQVVCHHCESPAHVCQECLKSEYNHTCSKNCAYQFKFRRERKGQQQEQGVRWLETYKASR